MEKENCEDRAILRTAKLFYGGRRRGKSEAIVRELINHLHEDNENRVGIYTHVKTASNCLKEMLEETCKTWGYKVRITTINSGKLLRIRDQMFDAWIVESYMENLREYGGDSIQMCAVGSGTMNMINIMNLFGVPTEKI